MPIIIIEGVARCAKCGAALDGDKEHACGPTYEQLERRAEKAIEQSEYIQAHGLTEYEFEVLRRENAALKDSRRRLVATVRLFYPVVRSARLMLEAPLMTPAYYLAKDWLRNALAALKG